MRTLPIFSRFLWPPCCQIQWSICNFHLNWLKSTILLSYHVLMLEHVFFTSFQGTYSLFIFLHHWTLLVSFSGAFYFSFLIIWCPRAPSVLGLWWLHPALGLKCHFTITASKCASVVKMSPECQDVEEACQSSSISQHWPHRSSSPQSLLIICKYQFHPFTRSIPVPGLSLSPLLCTPHLTCQQILFMPSSKYAQNLTTPHLGTILSLPPRYRHQLT